MNAFKRAFDLVTAGTLLAVSSPILICVAAAEKLTGQDVFFQQDRVGIGMEPFPVIKFTSMPKGSEKLGMLAAADDKRPTKLGRFLRKTKINEIPQLFNVLSGSMSMVGPRPLFPKQVAMYDERAQHAIATMHPGVTGLGSLFFSAEDALLASVPDKDRFYEEVVQPQKGRIEAYYCENWSLRLDMKIVLLTGLTVLTGRRMFPRSAQSLIDGFDADVQRFRQEHS